MGQNPPNFYRRQQDQKQKMFGNVSQIDIGNSDLCPIFWSKYKGDAEHIHLKRKRKHHKIKPISLVILHLDRMGGTQI